MLGMKKRCGGLGGTSVAASAGSGVANGVPPANFWK